MQNMSDLGNEDWILGWRVPEAKDLCRLQPSVNDGTYLLLFCATTIASTTDPGWHFDKLTGKRREPSAWWVGDWLLIFSQRRIGRLT